MLLTLPQKKVNGIFVNVFFFCLIKNRLILRDASAKIHSRMLLVPDMVYSCSCA